MSACVIPGIIIKHVSDQPMLSVDWSEILNLGIGRALPVVDRIGSSAWAIDAGSPASTLTLGAQDFDAASGTTWLVVSGGSAGDVVWLNNTITTEGAAINGKTTAPQTLVRQIRVRVQDC